MNEVIPEGWRLEPLASCIAESTAGEWGDEANGDENDTPVLRSTNFTDSGKIDYRNIVYRSIEERKRIKKALSKGDILLEKSGGSPTQPVGRVVFFERDTPYLFSNFTQKLVPREGNDAKYVFYKLLSEYQNGTVLKFQQQTTGIINFQLAEYLAYETLLAPLPEQQKIATILSSVDDVIEKTRAQIDKLKDLKTGMMQELLTQGIGRTEFKDSPVGRIPESWSITDLRSVVIKDGLQTGPFGSQLHAHEYIEWGIPVVMPKDMSDNRVDTSSIARISPQKADDLKKHSVRPGDILFSRRGDIGRFVLITKKDEGAICGTGCLRVRLSEVVSPSYLACYLTLSKIVEWLNTNAVGQTMLNLNTSILGNLPVVLPSKQEQESIGQTIISLEENIRLKSVKLLALEKHKKALMQDLLTGNVRVKLDSTEVAAA